MKKKGVIVISFCILCMLSCFVCKGVFSQYNFYPYNLNNLVNSNPYYLYTQSGMTWPLNFTNNSTFPGTARIYDSYTISGLLSNISNTFNNIKQNISLNMGTTINNTLNNTFNNPLIAQLPTYGVFQPYTASIGGSALLSQFGVAVPARRSLSENNDISEELEITNELMSLIDNLEEHLEVFQKMALEGQLEFSQAVEKFCETIEKSMENTMDFQFVPDDFLETVLPLAAEFAEKGMELGYTFASQGMEFGYEFASKGEEVGPMANRILFMATQIGVMADRIGEMADRILFMADKIAEFGDKILYVSQLIIYTEQLTINVGMLINENIRTLSDMILTLVALITDNTDYLQLRVDSLQTDQLLPLIYENMNLMLNNMHEYSLKLLDNMAARHENEMEVRELQIELRQETLEANECFCPGFCVSEQQCTDLSESL